MPALRANAGGPYLSKYPPVGASGQARDTHHMHAHTARAAGRELPDPGWPAAKQGAAGRGLSDLWWPAAKGAVP